VFQIGLAHLKHCGNFVNPHRRESRGSKTSRRCDNPILLGLFDGTPINL
jgi:hypothetical protein